MTYSLFCAKTFFENQDIIISYSDIIYNYDCIASLMQNNDDFAIMIDKNWLSLWKKRFTDVLSDAESLKIKDGYIIELGKKVHNINEIQGQYMGLFKFSKNFSKNVIEIWHSLNKIYNEQTYKNMYMTSFLQYLIDANYPAKAIFTPSTWLEIDNKSDLDQYRGALFISSNNLKENHLH